MITKTLIGCVLVAITVAVHAWGLSALLRPLMRSQAVLPSGFWPISWLLIRVTWVLLLIHLIEIAVWALFYLWAGLPAGRRVGVLFFRRDLCDGWLWRPGPADNRGGCSGRSKG